MLSAYYTERRCWRRAGHKAQPTRNLSSYFTAPQPLCSTSSCGRRARKWHFHGNSHTLHVPARDASEPAHPPTCRTEKLFCTPPELAAPAPCPAPRGPTAGTWAIPARPPRRVAQSRTAARCPRSRGAVPSIGLAAMALIAQALRCLPRRACKVAASTLAIFHTFSPARGHFASSDIVTQLLCNYVRWGGEFFTSSVTRNHVLCSTSCKMFCPLICLNL